MGWTSEMVAQTYKISREKQDAYALISHSRAEKVCNAPFRIGVDNSDVFNRQQRQGFSQKKSFQLNFEAKSYLLTIQSAVVLLLNRFRN